MPPRRPAARWRIRRRVHARARVRPVCGDNWSARPDLGRRPAACWWPTASAMARRRWAAKAAHGLPCCPTRRPPTAAPRERMHAGAAAHCGRTRGAGRPALAMVDDREPSRPLRRGGQHRRAASISGAFDERSLTSQHGTRGRADPRVADVRLRWSWPAHACVIVLHCDGFDHPLDGAVTDADVMQHHPAVGGRPCCRATRSAAATTPRVVVLRRDSGHDDSASARPRPPEALQHAPGAAQRKLDDTAGRARGNQPRRGGAVRRTRRPGRAAARGHRAQEPLPRLHEPRIPHADQRHPQHHAAC